MDVYFKDKKQFIEAVHDAAISALIFVCFMVISFDFFKGICKELEISELWAWIPLIAISKIIRKISIYACTIGDNK